MIAIKDMEMPSDCYNCPFTKNERTNDYGSFCKCEILEDGETINLLKHSKHYNCPLVEIEERKVGKWIGDKAYPICEKCGCNIYEKYISCSDYAEIIAKMDYCPNCGAEMRGAEDDSN